jgi:phosphate:Na+ symporter
MNLVDGALEEMDKIITHRPSHHVDVNKSYNIENEINNYRNQLKSQNINDVNNQVYGYQLGVYYMDIIAECEKLGDYVINVVDATK